MFRAQGERERGRGRGRGAVRDKTKGYCKVCGGYRERSSRSLCPSNSLELVFKSEKQPERKGIKNERGEKRAGGYHTWVSNLTFFHYDGQSDQISHHINIILNFIRDCNSWL